MTNRKPALDSIKKSLEDEVECRLCGKKFKMITWTHLRRSHENISIEEYKSQFGLKSVKSDELRYRTSQIAIRKQRYPVWPPERIIKRILERYTQGQQLKPAIILKEEPRLYGAAYYHFGGCRKAIEAAGLEYAEVVGEYTPESVITSLQKLYQEGKLEIAEHMRTNSEYRYRYLYYACEKHHGSYAKALAQAGIDYQQFRRLKLFPHLSWTKQETLERIHNYYREGKCHYIPAPLRAAAERIFGSWEKAIAQAGINNRSIRRGKVRVWNKERVIHTIQEYHRKGIPLIGTHQSNKRLYKAMSYHFGGVKNALKAAGLDYQQMRKSRPRGKYNPEKVIAEIKHLEQTNELLTAGEMQSKNPALYNACTNYYGSFGRAVEAAGIDYKNFRRQKLDSLS